MPTVRALPDLFVPVVAESEYHPYFARVLKHASESERNVVRGWAKGFADRDGKFVKEFQTTFNSSFWELYLHAALKELGLDVDLSNRRPDFLVDGHAGSLALEAVVSLNPRELSPDWAKHNPASGVGLGDDRERFLNLATLRLAQSIQAKSDKWLDSYCKLPACAERAYVICVAPFEQPQAYRQGTQGIARVLFGEPQELTLAEELGGTIVGGVSLDEAFKPSGSRVQLGLFRDPAFAHVSGVLFSALATWSKVSALAVDDGRPMSFHTVRVRSNGALEPQVVAKRDYVEGLLEGLHLFVNPFAARPLEVAPWAAAGVGIHRLLGRSLVRDTQVPDGVLGARACITVSTAEIPVHPPDAPKASDFPSHQIARPLDGEWFGGPAEVGLSEDAYLMLHGSWTICVGQDTVDRDWLYIVKRGIYLSMQDFIHAGDKGARHATMEVSIPTRDEALAKARSWISGTSRGSWRSASKKRRRKR